VTSGRSLLRVAAALVLAGVLVGPSAHAVTSPARVGTSVPAGTTHGQVSNEWLMMGPHCGAHNS
jgi:hypothetical protein